MRRIRMPDIEPFIGNFVMQGALALADIINPAAAVIQGKQMQFAALIEHHLTAKKCSTIGWQLN